ncbi:MAG: glycosyltransferase [Elusimicrobia bacterium]|nr:glycosyltransferase [Elusimicrobiota bacterium]
MPHLKVFQVIECGGPGGSGLQVANICNALDPARFDTALVYNVRPGSAPEDYRKLAKGAKSAFHVPEMTREITPGKDLAAYGKLVELFKREKPDVVHAHCSKAGFLARRAAKAAGVPKIFYSPRGYSFLMEDRGGLSRALYKTLERFVSGIGEIVAISESEAAAARTITSKTVHVAPDPYWADLPAPNNEPNRRETVVGACGRMTFARNPESFVRLAQRLTDSRNGLRCVWIGDGELGETVREMLRDMNLATRLEVTGWLEPAAARERMRGLDVFVHYSRWEGLPNAVLEAMAAGVPVVASDVAGNRDAIGDSGLYASDEVQLLERTLELVDDPERRRRLGTAARARVEKEFSRAKTLETLQRLYSA